MRFARLFGMFASFVVATALCVPEASASPTQIASCGVVATTDVTLVVDLICPDVGITVGNDGITIDLNGHTITGSRMPGKNGIDDSGFDDITVKNGAVQKFGRGIAGIGADRMHIVHVGSSGNLGVGIIISGVSARVSATTSSSNSDADDGIRIVGNFAHVTSSRASGNGANGISITGDSASVVSSQTNGNEIDGIHIDGAKARIRSSVASTNDDDGIDVSGAFAKIGQLRGGASSDRNHADFNGFPDGASDGFGQGFFVDSFTLATVPVGHNEASGNDDPAECNPIHLC